MTGSVIGVQIGFGQMLLHGLEGMNSDLSQCMIGRCLEAKQWLARPGVQIISPLQMFMLQDIWYACLMNLVEHAILTYFTFGKVPHDKPVEALHMLQQWLAKEDL
jgi:hypothetical protein